MRVNRFIYYSAISNFGYLNMPNTKTDPDRVIARSAATRQSMRRFRLPQRHGNPQGPLDFCEAKAPRNDDGFDPGVF
jgi:hypothetical protein